MRIVLLLLLFCFPLCGEITMSYPFNLSDPDKLAFNPQIASSSNGKAVVAWRHSEKINENLIQAVTMDLLNQKWSKPQTLSRRGEDAALPDVAMDGIGNGLVVWQNGQTIESASYKSDLQKWSQIENISTTDDQAAQANVVMNARGDALVMWNAQQGKSESFILKSRRYDAHAKKWSSIMSIGLSKEQNGDFEFQQQTALDDEGNALAIWLLNDPENNYQIKTAFLGKNEETWSDRESLCNRQSMYSSLAMNGSGKGIALWNHYLHKSASSMQVQGSTYDTKTQKWHATHDITELAPSIFNGMGPSDIAQNEAGDAIGVWKADLIHPAPLIRAVVYEAKLKKWRKAETIAPKGGISPTIAIDKRGNGVALWMSYVKNGGVIRLAIYDAQTKTWSQPFDISETLSHPPIFQLVMDPDGQILAVWNEYDGETSVIKASVGQLSM